MTRRPRPPSGCDWTRGHKWGLWINCSMRMNRALGSEHANRTRELSR